MEGLFSALTRSTHRPSAGALNISMDFNAAPSGTARGTEVIIPDNASPELRAAAERYNQRVADFALRNGIDNYPIRGVRTTSQNGRGVRHTVHTEPFFNTDTAMQEAIKANPAEFAAIYREAFEGIPGARIIAPHGVGRDRGAASPIFGDETTYGEMIANAALGNQFQLPELAQPAGATRARAPTVRASTRNQSMNLMEAISREPEKPGGLLGALFPSMSPESVDRVRAQVGGMRGINNMGMVNSALQRADDRRGSLESDRRTQIQMAQAEQQRRAQEEAAAREAVEAAQRKRVQIGWILENAPEELRTQLATGFASGMMDPDAVLKQMQGPETTTAMQTLQQRAGAAGLTPGTPEFQDFMLQGGRGPLVENNIGGGPNWETLGTQGGVVTTDPETGQPSYQVLPNSPLDVERREAVQASEVASQNRETSANIVLDEISLARQFIEGQTALNPTTGLTGSLLSNIDSTNAGALKNRLETIKANIGFDKLQAMRDASPTGGALGQVSEFENRLLQAVFGSLVQAQRGDEMLYNLTRLENIYDQIIHRGMSDEEARALYNDVVGPQGRGDSNQGERRLEVGGGQGGLSDQELFEKYR